MMQNYIKSIPILAILQFSIFFCSEEINANAFLEKSIRRLDGINHSMNISIISSEDDKKKVEKRIFDLSVVWNLDNNKYKMLYMHEQPTGVEAWVHHYKNRKTKKWIRLPKSGKIKEIKGKKSSEKLDFSEVTIPLTSLENNIFLKGEEILDNISCKILEVEDDDEVIKIWLDSEDYIVHKKEYYNKKSRLYKKVSFNNLVTQDSIKFYREIEIIDLKKKTNLEIIINSLKVRDFDNVDFFNYPIINEN